MSLPFAIASLLLLDAALFASIQPILGKLLLPIFGGSPMVWNSTLLFFHMMFFLGASYTALKQHLLSPRKQLLSHLILLGLSLIFLPIQLSETAWYMTIASPYVRFACALFFAVGMPIFMVSCNSVLLQTWCARSDLSYADNPYRLFSVSHGGMILGLVAYSLVEPYLGLKTLTFIWSMGFGVFSLAMVAILIMLRPHLPTTRQHVTASTIFSAPPSSQKAWWFLYPMVTAALLICYTQVVSIDLSSFSQLWVLPMVFYSLSFVLTFLNRPFAWLHPEKLATLQPFVLIPLIILMVIGESVGTFAIFVLHTCFFVITTLLFHGLLAAQRPEGRYLPQFYMLMGLGNVAGAFLIAVLAPLVLQSSIEYGLVMAGLCLLRPIWSRFNLRHIPSWVVVIGAVIGTAFALHEFGHPLAPVAVAIIASLLALTLYYLHHRPAHLAILTLGLVLLPEFSGSTHAFLYRNRSFFGSSTVTESGSYRYYSNGNTMHGMQCTESALECEANTYFHREGPFGHFMNAFQAVSPRARVAVMGLGVGTIAAWGEKGQTMEFIEIDPLVSQVANDYFTYLKKSPATIQVRLGDGRTVLRESPDAQYGLIVMDAFSSDAVPTHLVTLEALRCYTNKLAKDGAIMINATSRYYDFAPLMAGLARELNMTLLHGNDYHVNQGREGEMIYVSNWYVLTNNKKLIDTVKKDALWEAVNLSNSDSSVVWTDNYANQFDLLKIIDKTSDVITD